jgi:hypothetical protein
VLLKQFRFWKGPGEVGREHGLEGDGDDGREKVLGNRERLGTGRRIVRVIVVNSSMARVLLVTSNLLT